MSEFSPLIEPEDLVRQIESFGFTMFIGDDGVVHGKASVPGRKVPWEMRPLLEQLRLQNDAVVRVLRSRESDVVDLVDISQAESYPWLERVVSGEYRLVPGTKVFYDPRKQSVSMKLERVRADG